MLWFPEWPATAWARAEGRSVEEPVALFEANRVVSCSAAAQAEGVRRGHRRREAQVRCPALVVAPFDADRDHRVFAPLLDRLEEVSPGIQVIRPGLVALRMRGPARYYGGERPAAARLLEAMTEAGVVKAGVADGMFTAEQAAYDPEQIRVVPPGEAASFLAPLQ